MHSRFLRLIIILTIILTTNIISNAATWSLSEATYTNISKDLGANAFDIEFKPDGTKLYIPTGTQGDRIQEYNLLTPWDISTATLNYSLNASDPTSLNFSTDGTKMYYITFYSGTLLEYSLSTPWDISTATSTGESQSLAYGNNYGGSFDRSGEYFYALNSYDDKIHQYSLATPWDLSTSQSDNKTFSITYSYYYRDIVFNSDKSKFFIVSDNDNVEVIREFLLSDPTNISTASYNNIEINIHSQMTYPTGIYINTAGDTLYVSSAYETNDLHKYQLETPDSQAPTISNISVDTITNNSANINFTTNEDTTSKVQYGITSNLGLETSDANTTQDVEETIVLSNLISCAKYYYKVVSTDGASNETESSASTFYTTGCSNDISIVSSSEDRVETSGGTITLNTTSGTASISAPPNYYSQTLDLQINKLDNTNIPTPPTGKNLIEDNFLELLAGDTANNQITTFDEDITVVIDYGSDIETTYDESTLDLYKYNNGTWEAKNCTVDTTANTVTCSLPSFSTYGLFGSTLSSSSSSNSSTFSKDKRCHAKEPTLTTWIRLEPKDNGMYVTWTQYDANKVTIYIDDGTATYPWEVFKTSNDGHEFLSNVQPWQSIKILPLNHCNWGTISPAVSYWNYPYGWYNI